MEDQRTRCGSGGVSEGGEGGGSGGDGSGGGSSGTSGSGKRNPYDLSSGNPTNH